VSPLLLGRSPSPWLPAQSRDTSAFAVATLRSWWTTIGKDRYPNAHRLLICAVGRSASDFGAWRAIMGA